MNPEFYKIKDHEDLIKNNNNKAILNVSSRGLDKYREERNKLMKISTLAAEHDSLKKEVTEIKQTLSEILDLLRNKA